jgi:hypothetical protein
MKLVLTRKPERIRLDDGVVIHKCLLNVFQFIL